MAKRNKRSQGLGDTIEKVIKATGLDKFVDGKDCGCEERKQKLNDMFPYRYKARCMTELEYKEWGKFREIRTLTLSVTQVNYICELFASLFNRQVWKPCTNCSQLKELISMIDKIDKIYDTY